MKRTVKLIAVDNRYKESSYPYRCVYDDKLAAYRTGQHIDPGKPGMMNNLTTDEMTGAATLSEEKRKRFPFVINPLHSIQFYNGQEFDLSLDDKGNPVNYKDYSYEKLLREEGWMVAPSAGAVVPKKHYFYLKDDVFEATERITKADQQYEAERFVREEVHKDGLGDIGLLLSYKVKNFMYDPATMTELMLKDKIIQLCKDEPQKVLECKEAGAKDDIYVLKLALHNIITRRGTDFYDGSKFIGKDIPSVQKFMQLEENTSLVSKWNRLLAEKEGRIEKPVEPEAEVSEKDRVYEKIKSKTLPDLRRWAGQKKFPKDEWDNIESDEEMIKYILSKHE